MGNSHANLMLLLILLALTVLAINQRLYRLEAKTYHKKIMKIHQERNDIILDRYKKL